MTSSSRRPSASAGRGRKPAAGVARAAARRAVAAHAGTLSVPGIGKVELPSKGSLAYYSALAGLTALGLIEWPVAVVVGVGHLLAQQQGHAVLEEFGEGLAQA